MENQTSGCYSLPQVRLHRYPYDHDHHFTVPPFLCFIPCFTSGMPWEIQRGPDTWLLTKAGNIDQFGSELSFSPASTLGVWVAVNTPGPVATELISAFSDELHVAPF